MHRRSVLALTFICLGFSAAAAERPEDRWNLSDLYPSVAAWNADAAILESKLKEFGDCRGHLDDSVQRFKSCLDLNAEINGRIARLGVYASEQYAQDAGVAASSLFAEAILKGETGARDCYLNLRRAGNSDYPYEMVKSAGVDLASPAPYRAVASRMNKIMDDMEKILAQRKR
jgi:oligoendopeptidase F